MNTENNTGVLPPEGEESAEFENVSAGAEGSNTNSNSNTPLGNGPATNVLEVPPAAMNAAEPPAINNTEAPAMNTMPQTKGKKPQSAAQQQTIAKQAEERAALKNAGLAKPKIDVVATLASMKAKGDTKYNTAFANAVAGRPLNSYRTAKKTRGRKNTVINATNGPAGIFSRNAAGNVVNSSMRNTKKMKKKGVNSGSQATTRGTAASIQTNMRNRNIMNSTAMTGTVDAILDIAESIGKQMGEMKRMIKTLKTKRPRAPRAAASNSMLSLPPTSAETALFPPPTGLAMNRALPSIPEEGEKNNNDNNAFTPPP
jgi:hypothetical protein